MTRSTSRTSKPRPPRRRRPLTAVDLVPETPDPDLDAARELVDDVLALLDAGLIAPMMDIGEVRYAVADGDDDAGPPAVA